MHSAISYIAKNRGSLVKKLLVFSLLLCVVAVFLVSTFQTGCNCIQDCNCEEECNCATIICSVCEVLIERREMSQQKPAVASIACFVDAGLISAVDVTLESNATLVASGIRMNN